VNAAPILGGNDAGHLKRGAFVLSAARTVALPAGERVPFAWEKHYPPGAAWDAPIRVGTIPALFARAVADHASRPAIEFRDNLISYAELGRAAEAMAAALVNRGVKPQDAIAVYLPNTPLHPITSSAASRPGPRSSI
jgi:long-chain acyl-CoA synthetase